MKIKIKSEEMKLPIYILFPSALVRATVCSRPAAYALARQLRLRQEENLPPIPVKSIRKMQKKLRKCLKQHRGLTLVEVDSTDGSKVKIVL